MEQKCKIHLQSNDWKQKEELKMSLKTIKLLFSKECTTHQTPEYLHHAEKMGDYPPPRTSPMKKKYVNNKNIWYL